MWTGHGLPGLIAYAACVYRQSINQSINIRLLQHDKMQVNNSKQKGNTVSKKKSIDVKNVQIKKVKNVKT